ncbi:MaoC family dehydratase [Leptospira langatensis]|uniref:MaoC family dehydratase n=1 Tax=Leptospira langatensis TaxID=2484983 RepID=A0A5F1ZRW8_9LEPT|nr:MaoC family dehydratase [Leptospira langatensis]TGJ98905.1 MaoC family dehydratase [Leptospira langatensis]TGL40528.1 MaoC family dehydratase [Leptospira langatensis]
MPKLVISSFAELQAYEGKVLGVSEPHEITQAQIDKFADATLDHQWIHTDPARAAKESPFGTTIAHGYLTLSMAPYLLSQILELKNIKMGINYGMEKLRFLDPVKVGSKLQLKAELVELKDLKGTARMTLKLSFEVVGAPKAAAVGEVIYLYQFA